MGERRKISAEQALANLTDAMVEDILSLSDEDIRAELIEDGIDPEKLAADIKALIDKTIRRHFNG